jgi:hypothetical protein
MSDPKRWLDETGGDDDARRLIRLGKTLGPRPGSADRAWTEFLAISGGFPPDPSGGGGADGGGIADPGGAGALGGGAGGSASTAAATTTSASLTGASLVKTLLLGVALGTGGVLATEVVGRSVDTQVTSLVPAPTPIQVEHPTPSTPVATEAPAATPNPPVARIEPAPSSVPFAGPPGMPASSLDPTEPRPAPAATGVVSFPSETGVTGFPLDADRTSLLQREAREVADAKALLVQGRPHEALTLLRASAGRFPGGTLGQEREALSIEALASSGQHVAARGRARSFLARFPKSPLVERVRRFTFE